MTEFNPPIATLEPPSTAKTPPGPDVKDGGRRDAAPTSVAPPAVDLEARVTSRKQELIARLIELKSSTEDGAAEARDKLKARLSELAHIVKEGVVDGWANVGAAARTRIDQWLAK